MKRVNVKCYQIQNTFDSFQTLLMTREINTFRKNKAWKLRLSLILKLILRQRGGEVQKLCKKITYVLDFCIFSSGNH